MYFSSLSNSVVFIPHVAFDANQSLTNKFGAFIISP
jgi:hypothetical protein